MRIHIVQKGDTLWKIAQKYGVNFEQLKKINTHLSNPDLIMPGMKIKIPIQATTVKKKETQGHQHHHHHHHQHHGKETQQHHHHHNHVKEQQHQHDQPKKEMQHTIPKEQAKVKKEAPTVPYKPVVPKFQPITGVDVNNYYTVNLANMSLQQAKKQAEQEVAPQPLQQPIILPQPLPQVQQQFFEEEVKKEKVVEKPIEKPVEKPTIPQQEGVQQPMMQYCPTCCTPISQVMPGAGFNFQQAQAFQQGLPTQVAQPFPQVMPTQDGQVYSAEQLQQNNPQQYEQVTEELAEQLQISGQGQFQGGGQLSYEQEMLKQMQFLQEQQMLQQQLQQQQMMQPQYGQQFGVPQFGGIQQQVPQFPQNVQGGYFPNPPQQALFNEQMMMPMGAHQGGCVPIMPRDENYDDEYED